MSGPVGGPRLPAYEVDTLSWVASALSGNSLAGGAQVSAEVLTGEDAILLRFPSGGERVLYLDDRPHPEGPRLSAAEAEEAVRRADEAEDERDSARDVIRAASKLLDEIAEGDEALELPAWLKEQVAEFLEVHPAP